MSNSAKAAVLFYFATAAWGVLTFLLWAASSETAVVASALGGGTLGMAFVFTALAVGDRRRY